MNICRRVRRRQIEHRGRRLCWPIQAICVASHLGKLISADKAERSAGRKLVLAADRKGNVCKNRAEKGPGRVIF